MYRLTKFVGDLPNVNLQEPNGPAAAVGLVTPVAGGMTFDGSGAGAARVGGLTLTRQCWIVHETEAAAVAEYDFWRALVGERRKLYRERIATGEQQWTWARLMQVDGAVTPEQLAHHFIPLEFTFAVQPPGVWNGALHGGELTWNGAATWDGSYQFNGGAAATVVDSNPDIFTLMNLGNAEATQVAVTFTCGDVPISQVRIRCNNNQAISWAGVLAAGRALTIDAGTRTVTINGADAWDGLTRDNTHRSGYWLSLRPGVNTIQIGYTTIGTASGMAPTVAFKFYDAYR